MEIPTPEIPVAPSTSFDGWVQPEISSTTDISTVPSLQSVLWVHPGNGSTADIPMVPSSIDGQSMPSEITSFPDVGAAPSSPSGHWTQPEIFETDEVWVCIPRSFNFFQRCALCVDKLGVSLTPLVHSSTIPESHEMLWKGASALRASDAGECDVALMTQTITLPHSAIVEVVEDADEAMLRAATDADRTAVGSWGPFMRTLPAPRNRPENPDPPHEHVLALCVKSALVAAGRLRGGRRPGRKDAWNSSRCGPPEADIRGMSAADAAKEPVVLIFSFAGSGEEASRCVSKLREFRRYCLSLAFFPLPPASWGPNSHRDHAPPARRRSAAATLGDGEQSIEDYVEEWDLAPEEVGRASEVLAAPPPPPDPSKPSSIPCMGVSDEGQVFWYFPVKRNSVSFRALHRIAHSRSYLGPWGEFSEWPDTPDGEDYMLDDLASLDAGLASSLWRVRHEMADGELQWLDFTCCGAELMPDGSKISVNSSNKARYVRLSCLAQLVQRARAGLQAFADGFLEVVPADKFSDLVEGGVQRLLLGAATLSDAELNELERLVVPSGLVPVKLRDHARVREVARWFFQAARAGNGQFRSRLLEFWIGTSRVPLTGVQAIQPRPKLQVMVQPDGRGVKRIGSWPRERLPEGHTCGNELWMPLQDTYEQTAERLRLAVENFEAGFALK